MRPVSTYSRRTIALPVALFIASAVVGVAAAHTPARVTSAGPPAMLIFPVVGPVQFSDDFGAPRAQGGHQANDLLARWRSPLVAVEAGTVKLWTRSASAGCMLYLYGRSGTAYQYVHLNNDLTPRNDNRGGCRPGTAYAPGLADGQQVRAGELLGFVGDSGDATGKHPHVHFELHPRGGTAVSPYRWLVRARRLVYVAPNDAIPLMLTLTGTVRAVSTDAAGDSRLTIALQHVRLSNGWTLASDRTVVVAASGLTEVRHQALPGTRAASIDEATPGEPVAATVELERLTLHTQLAAPGALTVTKVLLQGTT